MPLRVRLVAGFVVAMLLLLGAAGGFVSWRVQVALDDDIRSELVGTAAALTSLVGPDGRLDASRASGVTGAGWQVVDRDGEVVSAGGPTALRPELPADRLAKVASSEEHTADLGSFLPASPDAVRVLVEPLAESGGAGDRVLVVAVSRARRDEALRELLAQLAIGLGSALVVAAAVGYVLARSALRPVERYRVRAAEIAAGASGLRLDVPDDRDDEVTRLGDTLNAMLAALEEAVAHERRFVDDASHELRTPLTLLRSRIELAARRSRSVGEHEAVLEELLVDVDRLSRLADQLLDLGSVHRAGPDADEPVDAAAVVSGVIVLRRVARPEQAGAVELSVPTVPGTTTVSGLSRTSLERIVTNLVDNAVLHGRGPVVVRLDAVGDCVRLRVGDAGEGMSPELLAAATERFARSPEARSRPGSGLGLAMVAQLVAVAGGELRLCSGGVHHSVGTALPIPCDHDEAMLVTVLLPG